MEKKVLENLLNQVQKPGRYLGNEWNVVKKNLSRVDIKFALCFPELYEIGMSHLGFKLLYHLLNDKENIVCERAFAPGIDMENLLRKNGLPLFSLESKRALKDFDIVGFSLAYEMTFTNAINILELSGIPILQKERTSSDPLVIAGGVTSFNPEPMSDFIDLFVIGEAEEVIFELIDKFKALQKKNSRSELLKELAKIKGVYVPSLYKVEYNEEGTLKLFEPVDKSVPNKIEKRLIKDLDGLKYPVNQIVPIIKIVHDRISLEIMRGCPNKCRFCQARVLYHHKRERSLSNVFKLSLESRRRTGYEEISLLSLSSGDYSDIKKLITNLSDEFESQGMSVSLPSLRIDKAFYEFPHLLKKAGTRGLTFAPEAGSKRLRDAINKNINIDHLQEVASKLFNAGWKRIKLYFMIGLPGEEEEDLRAILDIVHNLKGSLTVSLSSFIPKPHTPLQWSQMKTLDQLRDKFIFLKENVRKTKKIKLDFHDSNLSLLEAVVSRGDRRIGKVIYSAFKKGARFDAWGEHFKFDYWIESFKECSLEPAFYAYRKRSYEELLPWGHINTGISKEFLVKESENSSALLNIVS